MIIRSFDTFSGIGGFRIGLDEACLKLGHQQKCVMSSEILGAARTTYFKNFNETPRGDIWEIPLKDIPDHEILMGGFPCQVFSRCGLLWKHGGKLTNKDVREKAVFALIRILEEKKPKAFLFENVPDVLEAKNVDGSKFVDVFLKFISELGYETKYSVLNSFAFGLPQRRNRVFFVGILKKNNFVFPTSDVSFPYVFPCIKDILEKDIPNIKPFMMSHYLGNLKNHNLKENNRFDALKKDYEIRKLKKGIPTERTGKVNLLAIVYGDSKKNSYNSRQQDRLYSSWGISPTLATSCVPAFDTPQGWRKLTPREAARIQGFPEWFKVPSKISMAYRQLGNAVCVPVVSKIFENLLPLITS